MLGQFQFYDDNIYFLGCTTDNTGFTDYYTLNLYKMSLNGKNIEKIEDIGNVQYFYIYDNCIYYEPQPDYSVDIVSKLYVYNLETKQKREMNLSLDS